MKSTSRKKISVGKEKETPGNEKASIMNFNETKTLKLNVGKVETIEK